MFKILRNIYDGPIKIIFGNVFCVNFRTLFFDENFFKILSLCFCFIYKTELVLQKLP